MKRSFPNSIGGVARVLFLGVCLMVSALSGFAQAVITATGGVPGPSSYATLNAAMTALNAGTHTGAITITIGAGGTVEPGVVTIGQSGVGALSYTSILIKPATGTTPTIQGNVANTGLIYLLGASNITIDGSNTATGTTRDLTIRNTTGTAQSAVIRLGSPSATVGCSNNTFKNCKMSMAGTTVGIAIWSASAALITSMADAPMNNNTVQNNEITNAQTAVYAFGAAATDNNWLVTENDFTSLGFTGCHLNNTNNARITKNNISGITINGTTQAAGITMSFVGTAATISENKISGVNNTYALASPAAEGIFLSVNGGGSVNVFNNFISNVFAFGQAALINNGHGILQNSGGTINIHHNSIYMGTNQSSAVGISAAVCVSATAAGSTNLRNNIIQNAQTIGNRYGIYSAVAPAIFSGIDFNDYVSTSGNLGFITGTNCPTLAAMITNFTGNANSISAPPTFVGVPDLHLQNVPANLLLMVGTPIALVPRDIDIYLRSLTTPTIGAHEMINKITYTPLSGTCNSSFDTLNSVVINSPVGIMTAGALRPRIYFKKGAGPWFSTGGTQTGGTAAVGTWRFIIDASLMGGVTAGDVISYFVVAQTTGGTVFAETSAGFAAVDVNTVTTPPTTPDTYTVNSVSLLGLVTSNQACFNPTVPQTRPYAFTGTAGAPNQYMLTWSPTGPTPVPAFVALPPSPINVTIPATLPAAVYYGTVAIRNSTSFCNANYNIVLTVNPLPATISGSTTLCVGSSVVLSSASTGGTWSSSNTAVATIGIATGVVSGISGGTSNIVYTLPTGCSTFAGVNVVTPPGPITGPNSTCPGLTITLSNSIAGGSWMSSTPATATVNPTSGVVTGIMPGTALITYAISGCSPASKIVTINNTPNNITGTLYACEGFTTTLSTTSTGGTWISGSPGVATIGSATGLVTGISGGVSTITYQFTSTGCISTNTVTIFPAAGPITGGPVVCQGLSVALTNSVTGGTWSSTLPGVISVGLTSGIATGIAATGSALISYILPTGCFTTMLMYVSTPPTTIAGSSQVCSGYNITLTNGTGGGTWTSSNLAVATVGATTGIVTGVMGGVVNISYITTACNPVIYTVTVNQTPPPITGGITLCTGGSSTSLFNATPGGVWTISGSASISSSGVVTGLTIGGSNVVTYTVSNGCYVTAPIIVDTLPAPITGLTSICEGRSTTLSTLATGGVWSSNNSVIASVVATTGVVTGVGHGVTTISYAALSGCYVTTPFNVINPLPASVTLTRIPSQDTICMGIPVAFKAHPVNGGALPEYQWQKFGVNIPGATDSVYNYTPTHGDVIRVFMTNSLDICAAPAPAYVDMPINIYPNVAPVVSIATTSPLTMSFLGQIANFYAELTSGGSSPVYQWYVDGVPVPGATNNTFSREVYNNDTVYCKVNGNPPCETGSIANSNIIIIYADWLVTPAVEGIAANLSLFPNPNAGSFNLTGNVGGNINEQLEVEVVNVLGQVVFTGTTTAKNGAVNYKVALGKEVSAGTYMLRVHGGKEYKVFHFVVGN